MVEHDKCPRLGSLILTKRLGQCAMAQRWLALEEGEQTSHVGYCFPPCHNKADVRRFTAAVEAVASFDNPHALKIESFCVDQASRPWVITPFTGDADGLLTLERLLRTKGGQMHAAEAERALEQLLEAFDLAKSGSPEARARLHHGPVTLDQVLVDRRGRLVIELFGLQRQLNGLKRGNEELVRDEVRSIVEIGYQLVTGLRAEEPLIPAGRLVKKLDAAWDVWLDYGLDPGAGFESVTDAAAKLPGRAVLSEGRRPIVTVRGVFERLRTGRAQGV